MRRPKTSSRTHSQIAPPVEPDGTSDAEPSRGALVLAIAALACLVVAVFYPIVGFGFGNYDTEEMVVHNPYIQGLTLDNIKHILTSRLITSYYPVRTLSFALDYQIWGLWAGGFELTNGLIHLANTLLAFWLVLRLFRAYSSAGRTSAWDVFSAAFAAALFAVHPVVVEPVTWIPGREELLMTLGALACIHFHASARKQEEGGTRWKAFAFHGAAAVGCAAACLSNAAGAVIPLLVVGWDLAIPPRPTWRRLFTGTALLWTIALGTVILKKLDPQGYRYAMDVPVLSEQRLRVVLSVFWLNLKTLVWPTRLTVDYTAITVDKPWGLQEFLGILAIGAAGGVLWAIRRKRLVLLGVVWFLLALAPSAQIVPHHIQRADRFLYLPLIGVSLAIGSLLRPLRGVLKNRSALLALAAAGLACLLLLERLSARQVQTWESPQSLWEHAVIAAPDNSTSHYGLARVLGNTGQFDRALAHYRQAIILEPVNYEVMNAYAELLTTCEDETRRDYRLAIRLAEQACALSEGRDPKFGRTLAMAYEGYGHQLISEGRAAAAVECFEKALQADESYGIVLPFLAEAYASVGRHQDAARAFQMAADRARAAGEKELADALQLDAESVRKQADR